MADIYGSHFEYNGVSSRTYGLIIANVTTNRMLQLLETAESATVFNRRNQRHYMMGVNYSDSPFSFDVDIITDNYEDIPREDRRSIEKWLFSPTSYKKLYIDEADDPEGDMSTIVDGQEYRYYIGCRITNPRKIESDSGIIGYQVTIEADSNMFWVDPIAKTFNLTKTSQESVNSVSVNIDTDLNEYIYPDVEIQMGSTGGDITISNNTDNTTRFTAFKNVSPSAKIVMKGDMNYISGQYYDKFTGRNFIRLLDGVNKLIILGDIRSLKLTYSLRRVM